jgi:hypothetical protein
MRWRRSTPTTVPAASARAPRPIGWSLSASTAPAAGTTRVRVSVIVRLGARRGHLGALLLDGLTRRSGPTDASSSVTVSALAGMTTAARWTPTIGASVPSIDTLQ